MSMNKQLRDYEKRIVTLEKENKILRDIDIGSSNTNQLKQFVISLLCADLNQNQNQNLFMLRTIFPDSCLDLTKFLSDRVESLEFQNFNLLAKNQKYSYVIKNYIEELVEYSEVIVDIKNVLNQVFESQSLTREFLIIRETLNNRNDYLLRKKDEFLQHKESIESEMMVEQNNEFLCNNKIAEFSLIPSKGHSVQILNKLQETIEEKIMTYSNLMQNQIGYEEGNQNQEAEALKHNLLTENDRLKAANLKLKNFIMTFMKDKDIEMDEESMAELHEILNTANDFVYSQDLFYMLKSQALLIENMIVSN